MAGLFGLIDPEGRFVGQMDRALVALAYRGVPRVVSEGAVVLGVCGDGDTVLDLAGDRFVAMEGTVDAWLDRPEESIRLADPVDEVIRVGTSALDQVAGVFALAVYHPETDVLMLARDAFGVRPLYYARRGEARAFASDPHFLIRLGLASGAVDGETRMRHVAGELIPGERSEFEHISRVPGGRFVRLGAGRGAQARWFRPDAAVRDTLDPGSEVAAIRTAVSAATRDAHRRGPAALLLSGGRDSASIAICAAESGLSPEAITYDLPSDPVVETPLAQELADRIGLAWRSIEVPQAVDQASLERLVAAAASPLLPPAFPLTTSLVDAIAGTDIRVVIDGEGGDLFCAPPVALLDLAAAGEFRAVAGAARGYRRYPRYGYLTQAKMIGRSILPRSVVRVWDEGRGRSPSTDYGPPILGARSDLVWQLLAIGQVGTDEVSERIFARMAVTLASPLLDLRVVRSLLRSPSLLRVPTPTYKPLLRDAFLGSLDVSRLKVNHRPYYRELALSLRSSFPEFFCEGPAKVGLRRVFVPKSDPLLDSLRVVGPEAWDRWGGSFASRGA
jgi:hypothetical protein